MFSMCSELTPRARILDTRIPQLMRPCLDVGRLSPVDYVHGGDGDDRRGDDNDDGDDEDMGRLSPVRGFNSQ